LWFSFICSRLSAATIFSITRRKVSKKRSNPLTIKTTAFTAIVAATIVALLPFHKPADLLDGRLAKHILLSKRQKKMDDEPMPMGCRPSSPVESRLPRDREDPCSFRTRLVDPVAGSEADVALENADDDLKFDDIQCISVGRSAGKFKTKPAAPNLPNYGEHGQANEGGIANEHGRRPYSPLADMVNSEKDERNEVHFDKPTVTLIEDHLERPMIHKTFSDPTTGYRTVLVDKDENDHHDDYNDEDNMEAMNMPFWNLPKRQKLYTHHAGDTIPDDMSIISDISLIPTYFPSDVMKQQRPQHRALVKRLIRAKARAARHTVREFKRSCRSVVENVFVDPAAAHHKGPMCVAVGSAC
jgi:hypothetical protein